MEMVFVMDSKKELSELEDEKAGRSRFVDQPGQWVDITPPEVKKRQAEGWKKLFQMLQESDETGTDPAQADPPTPKR